MAAPRGRSMNNGKKRQKRLDEQRERQQAYRDRVKAERRPSRDDIARIVLHEFIMNLSGRENTALLDAFFFRIVDRLVEQGFDKEAAADVFDNLVERYTKGKWDFRRKVHLMERPAHIPGLEDFL